jgi:hypothetical protein
MRRREEDDMSKSTISRDEKRRRLEATEGGEGVAVAPPVKVTVWAGWENYECQLCAYATLDAEGMAGHLRGVHGWRESALSLTLSQGEREPEVVASAAVAGDENNKDEVM